MEVCVLAPVWRAREEANVLALYNLFTHPEFTMSPPLFNDADIGRARSRGATWFYEQSTADVALWIDSDIDFKDEDALTICRQAREYGIVAGIYPTRSASQAIPASRMLVGRTYTFGDDPTPQPIQYAAGGFVAVAREVYGALIVEDAECQQVLHANDKTLRMRPFYLPMIGQNDDGSLIYLSEDWAFSERARRVGYPSYANCAVDLAHAGAYRFTLRNLFTAPQIPRPIRFTRHPDGNLVERTG